ncbi:MAG: tRNA (adenosine(37)-N6)-dimethylallyltransferase MiaA [Gemmatimonadota bacterium]
MTSRPRSPVPVVLGPTASGKTALSLRLAELWDGEIVSMDSRQVYRGLDIGTDKVSLSDRARAPHHGLDLVGANETYSAGRFAREARRWIADIQARGRIPILVGGTGFFLKALTEPMFEEPPIDAGRRDRLRTWLVSADVETLGRWADALDPERAPLARAGGRQRLQRLVEVALLTGQPLSYWHRRRAGTAEPLAPWIILLELPRDEMDRRIGDRVRRMRDRGLLEEVQALRAAGYRRGDPGLSGTGYREIYDVLDGSIDLEDALDEMTRQTRRYARRQLTWFRHQLPPVALRVDATLPLSAQVETVAAAWRAVEEVG